MKTAPKPGRLLIQAQWSFCKAALLLSLFVTGQVWAAKAPRPLRLHPANTRYFTNDSSKAIYPTSSHTWTNLRDVSGYKELTELEELGKFQSHLEWLRSYNHSFMRLWILEHTWDAAMASLLWPPQTPTPVHASQITHHAQQGYEPTRIPPNQSQLRRARGGATSFHRR